MAKHHAARALALVGTPFRPQGRKIEQGLDCVGVALCAFDLCAETVRDNYRLRGRHLPEIRHALGSHFRKVSRSAATAGDLLLLSVAPDQYHLAILTEAGFVHADAGLRKVVETPGEPPWSLVAAFRRRIRKRGK